MTWQGFGASAFTKTGCLDGPVTTEGVNTLSCDVTTTSAPVFSARHWPRPGGRPTLVR